MTNKRYCGECQAICAELRAALDEVRPAAMTAAQVHSDLDATRKMMNGAEELEAAEILGSFHLERAMLGPFAGPEHRSPRVRAAVRKVVHHLARTGHTFPFPR